MVALSDGHLEGLPRFLSIKPCSTDVAASLYKVAAACLRRGAVEEKMKSKQPNSWIDLFSPHWSDQRQDECESTVDTKSLSGESTRIDCYVPLQCIIYESCVYPKC